VRARRGGVLMMGLEEASTMEGFDKVLLTVMLAEVVFV